MWMLYFVIFRNVNKMNSRGVQISNCSFIGQWLPVSNTYKYLFVAEVTLKICTLHRNEELLQLLQWFRILYLALQYYLLYTCRPAMERKDIDWSAYSCLYCWLLWQLMSIKCYKTWPDISDNKCKTLIGSFREVVRESVYISRRLANHATWQKLSVSYRWKYVHVGTVWLLTPSATHRASLVDEINVPATLLVCSIGRRAAHGKHTLWYCMCSADGHIPFQWRGSEFLTSVVAHSVLDAFCPLRISVPVLACTSFAPWSGTHLPLNWRREGGGLDIVARRDTDRGAVGVQCIHYVSRFTH